jgi:hypothetical protein
MASLKTLKNALIQRRIDYLVGRRKEIEILLDNLSLSSTKGEKKIVFIRGENGMGKTSLMDRFRYLAAEKGFLTGVVDDSHQDTPEVLHALANQFNNAGHALEGFKRHYGDYRAKNIEVATDKKTLEEAVQKCTASVIRMATNLTGIGPFIDLVDDNQVGEKAKELFGSLNRKLKNKDDVDLIDKPAEALTRSFVKDLSRIISENKNRPVILFFDDFETTGNYLDLWLRKLLEGYWGDLPENVWFVIAGRTGLNPKWAAFPIRHINLPPLSDDDAAHYLRLHKILNEDTIHVILKRAGGMPSLLATMASQAPKEPLDVTDPSGDAVKQFLYGVEDPKLRQAAVYGAFPIVLNQDILATLINPNEADVLFDNIRGMPFVKQVKDGWVFDEVVRNQMLRYFRKASPSQWQKQHENLAAYFWKKTNAGKSNPEGSEVGFSRGYWLYHRLCSKPESTLVEALELFFEALATDEACARMTIEMLQQAGVDADSEKIENYGKRLIGVMGEKNNKWDSQYQQLLEWRPVMCHLIHNRRRSLKALSDIVASYSQDLGIVWAIARRGKIYRSMGNDKDALEDFAHAIELLEKNQLKITPRSVRCQLGTITDDKDDAVFDALFAENGEGKIMKIAA